MSEIRAFISYAHQNEIWLTEWLDPLKKKPNDKCLLVQWQRTFRKQNVKFWYDEEEDEKLRGGDPWRERIFEEIDKADIAILLVTQDFVISPFIMDEELPRILARYRKGELEVLPVLVQPIRTKDLGIDDVLQWTPRSPIPLSEYYDFSKNEFEKARNLVLDALENVIRKAKRRKAERQAKRAEPGKVGEPPPQPPPKVAQEEKGKNEGKTLWRRIRGFFFQEESAGADPGGPPLTPPPSKPLLQEERLRTSEEATKAPEPAQAPAPGEARKAADPQAVSGKETQAAPGVQQKATATKQSASDTGTGGDRMTASGGPAPADKGEPLQATKSGNTITPAPRLGIPRIGTVRLAGNASSSAPSSGLEVSETSPRVGAVQIVQPDRPSAPQAPPTFTKGTTPRLGQISLTRKTGPAGSEPSQESTSTRPKPSIGAISIRKGEQ